MESIASKATLYNFDDKRHIFQNKATKSDKKQQWYYYTIEREKENLVFPSCLVRPQVKGWFSLILQSWISDDVKTFHLSFLLPRPLDPYTSIRNGFLCFLRPCNKNFFEEFRFTFTKHHYFPSRPRKCHPHPCDVTWRAFPSSFELRPLFFLGKSSKNMMSFEAKR